MLARGRLRSAWLLAALIAAGSPGRALALDQLELDANRALWDLQGISNYDFLMQTICFCLPEVTRPGVVSVRSGAITSVIDAETSEERDPGSFLTVDGLFDVLQEALDQEADWILAEFDGASGYPHSIDVDYSLGASDDELSYRARGLVVVPEAGGRTAGLAAWLALGALWRSARHRL